MYSLILASASLNQTPLDWEKNKKNILAAVANARAQGVGILCLPELCLTGYGSEDAFLSASVQQTALDVLFEILPETQGIVVALGLPLKHQGKLYDVACLIVDGKIAGFRAKFFLAREGVHYEPRWFEAWPQDLVGAVEIRGVSYPIGDLVFLVGGVKIGFEICEDAWVEDRPARKLVNQGVSIILNTSASHFAFAKHEQRKRLVCEGSKGLVYVYSNLLGNEAGRVIYDGGSLIAQDGKLISVGRRFSYRDFVLTTALVKVPEITANSDDSKIVKVDFKFSAIKESKLPVEVILEPWETGSKIKEEEFTRAVCLGLFDYLRKSHAQGFVISLSGGADSSAVSCLCFLMVKLGIKDLGFEGFLQKLIQAGVVQEKFCCVEDLLKKLITCVYQATQNSSKLTLTAAERIAKGVGAKFLQLDVDGLVKNYVSLVEEGLGQQLNWQKHDIELQNIQARVRSPGVWLIANMKKALLLSTSNRSEAAVGYATMDGDSSGGLNPIGGIDKAFLRKWLAWLEKEGPWGLGPIAELNLVNQQEPTAELRPLNLKQTDEADLMPYEVLDRIERLAIRDRKMPIEVLEELLKEAPQFSKQDLDLWVKKFFRFWAQSQWKRERFAPAFHLDQYSLDPKTCCRFPILSGGFVRELNKMGSD